MTQERIGVLFVCTANICRSPMAHAVALALADRLRIADHLTIDSASTHGYLTGEPIDPRAAAALQRQGYTVPERRSRPVEPADFRLSRHILAMDRDNLEALENAGQGRSGAVPRLLTSFSMIHRDADIADPYGGTARDFDRALAMIEESVEMALRQIRRSLPA